MATLDKHFGFSELNSYLRWVANYEVPIKNINDLVGEGTGKLIEVTIRFQDKEWSISCSASDYEGHANSRSGHSPHYHLQIRIGGQIFVKYSDLHLEFHEHDLFLIEAERQNPQLVRSTTYFGEGMRSIFNEQSIHEIIGNSVSTEDPEDASLHIQTLLSAPEGEPLSGDILAELIEEAKREGVPVATKLHRLGGDQRVMVEPGPGVPELASRAGGRKKGPGQE